MPARLRSRLTFANVASATALFVALTTGGAYATHLMVNGSDVVDESLTRADVRGRPGTGTTAAVNGSLSTHDISGQPANAGNGTPFVDGTLSTWDVRNGALRGDDVADNALKGDDIDEASLGKVPDADELDGIDSADVTRGHSQVLHNSVTNFGGPSSGDLIEVPGYGTVAFDCNSTGQVALSYTNDRNFIQFVVEDQGGSDPIAYRLNPGAATTQTAHVDADAVTYHVSNGLVETGVIMVAGQKYNDPNFPGVDFCTLQATAITRFPL